MSGPLAPLGLRFLAASVDVALLGLGLFGGGLLGWVVLGLVDPASAVLAGLFGGLFGAAVPTVISWVLIAEEGQSLGKRWTGLRIVRTDGSLPGFWNGVVLRSWVVAFLIRLCGVFYVVDALLVLRADRRAGHDWIAGTRVIRDPMVDESVAPSRTFAAG